MVLGIITKYGALAIGLLTIGLFFKRSVETSIGQAGVETGQAIGSIGGGLGSLGSGISSVLNAFISPVKDFAGFALGVAQPNPSASSGNQNMTNLSIWGTPTPFSQPKDTGTPTGTTGGFNPTQSTKESTTSDPFKSASSTTTKNPLSSYGGLFG